jgi:hypothetical protein
MVVLHQHLNKQILIYILIRNIYIYLSLSLSNLSIPNPWRRSPTQNILRFCWNSGSAQPPAYKPCGRSPEPRPTSPQWWLSAGGKKATCWIHGFGHAFYWFTEIDSRVHCEATNITGGSSWRQWHIHVWKFTEFYWIKFDKFDLVCNTQSLHQTEPRLVILIWFPQQKSSSMVSSTSDGHSGNAQ